MKQYLIYDVGFGEQGNECRYVHYRYYLCEGESEIDAVKDWIRQSPFKENDFYISKGIYFIGDGRSWLNIVPLLKYADKEYILGWKELIKN